MVCRQLNCWDIDTFLENVSCYRLIQWAAFLQWEADGFKHKATTDEEIRFVMNMLAKASAGR